MTDADKAAFKKLMNKKLPAKNTNTGNWLARVENEKRGLCIEVKGAFHSINGEKPHYSLERNNPQGTNSSELILTLKFGHLADLHGAVDFSVHYSEKIADENKFQTVLVVDEDGSKIANIVVKKLKQIKNAKL